MNNIIFKYVTHQAEEIMCRRISPEPFRMDREGCGEKFLYVLERWGRYNDIIDYCCDQRKLVLIVAPIWEEEKWLQKLRTYSTHMFVLPTEAGTFWTRTGPQ